MDWWLSFYDHAFADSFLANADDATETSARFLLRELRLGPGMRVFDQCCGTGRLSAALSQRGVRVVGVDASAAYVERARRLVPDGDFHAGDAFDFTPASPVDAAFNWYTSFGYTADDARNALMLQRTMEALRPGGHFALDYLNVPSLLRDFRPRLASQHGVTHVERVSQVDLARGMLEQTWTFTSPGRDPIVRRGATRLYLPHMLVSLVERAGFVDVRLFGGDDGSPCGLESRRCIVVARKPEHS